MSALYHLYCRMLAGYVDKGQYNNLAILQRMTAYQFLLLHYSGPQDLDKHIDSQAALVDPLEPVAGGYPEVMEYSPVANGHQPPCGGHTAATDKLKEDNRALLKTNDELRKEIALLQHKLDTVSKDYTLLKEAESAMIGSSADAVSHLFEVGRFPWHDQEPQKVPVYDAVPPIVKERLEKLSRSDVKRELGQTQTTARRQALEARLKEIDAQAVPDPVPVTPENWYNCAFERESWPSIHTWLGRSDRGSFEYIIGGDNGTWVYHRMSREHSMKEMMMYREDEVAKSLPDLLDKIEKHPGGCGKRTARLVKVPEGQTPLDDNLRHPLLDVFNAGMTARDSGEASPYHGHSLEHCLHAAGWVQRDLRIALDKAQGGVERAAAYSKDKPSE